MAQFKHPNVLPIIGVVSVTRQFLIVTPFCEHGTLLFFLSQRFKFTALPLISRLKICADVAAGVAYLRECSFIHRDLASRNVLVNSGFQFQISDFGMSRKVRG